MKKTIIASRSLAVVASVGGGAWYWKQQSGRGTAFRFEEVKRGKLVATVGSTGTLQPREFVDVGAQVLGRIIFIGKDPNTQSGIVDWGSEVEGPVLDKDGKVDQAGHAPGADRSRRSTRPSETPRQAAVKSAEAALKSAQADVLVKTATLSRRPTTGAAPRSCSRPATADRPGRIRPVQGARSRSAKANLEVSKANVGRLRPRSPRRGQPENGPDEPGLHDDHRRRSTASSSTAASTSARPWSPACRPPACSSSPRT